MIELSEFMSELEIELVDATIRCWLEQESIRNGYEFDFILDLGDPIVEKLPWIGYTENKEEGKGEDGKFEWNK